jgi:CHAT domain-containing protein
LEQPGSFDVLHFACHGEAASDNIGNAQIVLGDRIEAQAYVNTFLSATTVEQFANLRMSGGGQPVVVLNACQLGRSGYRLTGIGGFAEAFLRAGAGLFVGALWSVGDLPARNFTEEFYKQLKAGNTIAEAAVSAREKSRSVGDATWLAYVVYGHPHGRISLE